jgi:hypothetical protein
MTRPKRPTNPKARRAAEPPAPAPDFCGFQCPHSAFAPADTAGLCRTMAAVYCKKLRRLVAKNGPCALATRGTKKKRRAAK